MLLDLQIFLLLYYYLLFLFLLKSFIAEEHLFWTLWKLSSTKPSFESYCLQQQIEVFYFIFIIIKQLDKLLEPKKSVGPVVFFQVQFCLDLDLLTLIIFVNLELIF